MKYCKHCVKTKPLSEFYIRRASPDGHDVMCKGCRSEACAHYYAANCDRVRARTTAYRTAHPEWKRDYDAQYGKRESSREYQAAYRAENRERLREQQREQYAGDEAWRQKRIQNAMEYRVANRERIRQWHRDYSKTPARAADLKMRSAVRRALKKGTRTIPFGPIELEAKWRYWNGCCWICGAHAVAWDHVKPLTVGGAHAICNLRPACRSCNSAKGNRWPLPSRAKILGLY